MCSEAECIGRSIASHPSSFPPTAHSALTPSCLFPCPTKTSLDPGWVPAPALTLASVSSFGKGGSLEAFGVLCFLCLEDLAIFRGLPPPQPPGHPAGPYAACVGWVPGPRRGDQLVGAEGLERVAPGAGVPVTLHLWPALQQRVAAGGAFLPQGLSSPPTPGLGLKTPRAVG